MCVCVKILIYIKIYKYIYKVVCSFVVCSFVIDKKLLEQTTGQNVGSQTSVFTTAAWLFFLTAIVTDYDSKKMAEEERSAEAEKLKEKANNYFKGKIQTDGS